MAEFVGVYFYGGEYSRSATEAEAGAAAGRGKRGGGLREGLTNRKTGRASRLLVLGIYKLYTLTRGFARDRVLEYESVSGCGYAGSVCCPSTPSIPRKTMC